MIPHARNGPLESHIFAAALAGFAVDASKGMRLHGFDVETDLTAHYRFSDIIYLALCADLPNAEQSRAFEMALGWLLPVSVAEGPIHAAVLSGSFGAPPSGVLATAATTLADYATEVIEAVLATAATSAPLPEALRASSAAERAAVARLRATLRDELDVPLLNPTEHDPSREVALVAVLYACGLTTRLQLATALTLARLPSAAAEAAPRRSSSFVQDYPMNTPPFRYVP